MPFPTAGLPAQPNFDAWMTLETAALPTRLHRLLEALDRHKVLAAGVVVAALALAAAASWIIPPYYVADASIIIQPANLHPAEVTGPGTQPPIDLDRDLQTQLTILGSRTVALPVIDTLQLYRRDPDMAHTLDGINRQLARKGWRLSAETRDQIADDVFAGHLKLLPDKLSSTVHIDYASRDPALAAAAANAVADSYLATTEAARRRMEDANADWMQAQLASVQAELRRDEDALADFQSAHGYTPLADLTQQDPLLARLSDANHALGEAEAARIDSAAQLQSYPGNVVAALPADLRNPAIDSAVGNVGAAQDALSTLASTYQPDFPLVVEARARLADAQQKLAALRQQISAGLQQNYAAALQREASSRQLVDQLSRQAAADSALSTQYAILKARAAGQQTLYDDLRQKLAEAHLMATLPVDNIRVLDRAAVPLLPSYPRLPLDLGLGLGVGLVAALAMVLARERWSDVVTGAEDIHGGLGEALAPLGMVPDLAAALLNPAGRPLLPAAANSKPLESYARIAANLVARGGPPRAILVTSPNPEEGKTVTTCQLGLALAAAGWRTCIVDADVRRPGCHRRLGMDNRVGLIAAQQGQRVEPEPVMAGLDLVPCESAGTLPLQARVVGELLQRWKERYDYILIDTPPGNLTGEAIALASVVEGVLLVLGWRSTRLSEARPLCEEMARAHAPLIGSILNRTDARAFAYRYHRRHQGYPSPSYSLSR